MRKLCLLLCIALILFVNVGMRCLAETQAPSFLQAEIGEYQVDPAELEGIAISEWENASDPSKGRG